MALLLTLVALTGCESEYDKCFKTNHAKLESEVTAYDANITDAFYNEAPIPKEDRTRIENAFLKETNDFVAATKKQLDAGCPRLDENQSHIYEGTECFLLNQSTNELYKTLMSLQKPLILEVFIRELAKEKCNSQGFYE